MPKCVGQNSWLRPKDVHRHVLGSLLTTFRNQGGAFVYIVNGAVPSRLPCRAPLTCRAVFMRTGVSDRYITFY